MDGAVDEERDDDGAADEEEDEGGNESFTSDGPPARLVSVALDGTVTEWNLNALKPRSDVTNRMAGRSGIARANRWRL